jgi:hypothetical protein
VLARIPAPAPAVGKGKRGQGGSHCWALLTALDNPLRDFHRLYGYRWEDNGRTPDNLAAWPAMCPWQPELAAAHLLRPLSDGLKTGGSPAAFAVGRLADPGHALGPVGHLALLTGLAAAGADTRIAAAGVWSQAALDGRLSPELAANALVTGVSGGAVKLSRVADGLQHACLEPLAGYRIVETVLAAAGALIPIRPPGLHLLLELAARIGASTGIPDLPGPVTAIAARRAGTQLVAASRRLADGAGGAGGQAPDRGQVIAQALAARR